MAIEFVTTPAIATRPETPVSGETKGKALFGGLTTGAASVGGFLAGAAFAPGTGGLSLIIPLASGIAAGFGAEKVKQELAEDSPFFQSVLASQRRFPGTATIGEFMAEGPLAARSIARIGTKAILQRETGVAAKTIASEILKETGTGAAIGAGISAGIQGTASTLAGQGFRIDPAILIGDAILGGTTTKAPLTKTARFQHIAEIERLKLALPDEAKVSRRFDGIETTLRRAGGKEIQEDKIFKKYIKTVTDLQNTEAIDGRRQIKTNKTIANELESSLLNEGIDVQRKKNVLSVPEDVDLTKTLFGDGERTLLKTAKDAEGADVLEGVDPSIPGKVGREGTQTAGEKLTRRRVKLEDEINAITNQPQNQDFDPSFQTYLKRSASERIDNVAKSDFERWRANPSKTKLLIKSLQKITGDSQAKFSKLMSDRKVAFKNTATFMEMLTNGRVKVGATRDLMATYDGRVPELTAIYTGQLKRVSKTLSDTDRAALDQLAVIGNAEDRFAILKREKAEGTEGLEIFGLSKDRIEHHKTIIENQLGTEGWTRVNDALAEYRKILGDGTFIDGTGREVRGFLRYANEEGLITTDEIGKMTRDHPNYSPIAVLKYLNDFADGTTGNKSVLQYVKDLGQNETQRIDALLNAEEYLVRGIQEVERNKVRLQVLDIRRKSLGEGGEFLIQLAPRDKAKPPAGMTTFKVRELGKVKTFFAPTDFVRAMEAWNPPELHAVVKILSKPAQWFRAMAVNYNLTFAGKNLVRDIGNAILRLEEIKGPKGVVDISKSLVSASKEILDFKTFQRTGGRLGREAQDVRDMRVGGGFQGGPSAEYKQVLQQTKKKGFTFESAINLDKTLKGRANIIKEIASLPTETSEEIVRLAAFKVARAAGKTNIEASFIARSLLDYAVQGQLGSQINAVIPFFNARIRGAANFLDLFNKAVKDPEKFGGAFLLKVGMTGFLPTMAAAIYAKKTGQLDSWIEASPEQREVNFIMPIGKPVTDALGREHPIFFRIPKPDYLQPVLSLAEGLVVRALKGEDNTVTGEAIRGIIDSISAISPIAIVDRSDSNLQNVALTALSVLPPVLRTQAEIATNTKLYTGAPIIPPSLQGLPPELQAYPHTPELYRRLAAVTGTPALRLQALVEGTLSTGVPRDVVNVISNHIRASIPEEMKTDVSGNKNLQRAQRLVQRGFFMVGRQKTFEPEMVEALEQVDNAEKLRRFQRNQQLTVAEKQWEAGNTSSLRQLARNKDKRLASEAKRRIEDIRLKLTSKERILRGKSTTQRAVLIAVEMLESPVPTQLLREMQRKRIATGEVTTKVRQILRQARTPEEAVQYGILLLQGRDEG